MTIKNIQFKSSFDGASTDANGADGMRLATLTGNGIFPQTVSGITAGFTANASGINGVAAISGHSKFAYHILRAGGGGGDTIRIRINRTAGTFVVKVQTGLHVGQYISPRIRILDSDGTTVLYAQPTSPGFLTTDGDSVPAQFNTNGSKQAVDAADAGVSVTTTGAYFFVELTGTGTFQDRLSYIEWDDGVASAPTVTSYAPSTGAVGSAVTITGANFTGATGATIGGVALTSFVVVNSTTITAVIPAGATTNPIIVTSPVGSGTGPSFTVYTPVFTSLTYNNPNSSYTIGVLLLPITVTARDQFGAVFTGSLANCGVASLTLSVTVAGTLSEPFVAGVATFDDLTPVATSIELTASGVAQSVGSATLSSPGVLTANGTAISTGSASLRRLQAFGAVASNVAFSTGSATLTPAPVAIPAGALGFFVNLTNSVGGGYTPGSYQAGALLMWRVRAKAPVGYTFDFLPGRSGTGTVVTPLTSMAGTGAYQEYVWKHQVGTTGTFEATGYVLAIGAALGVIDCDVVSVVDLNQSTNIFGPSLDVTPVAGDTQYLLYYVATGVVDYKVDSAAYVNATASPIVVNRPGAGSAGTVVTIRGTTEGQVLTNSVTIPAIDADTVTPDLTIVKQIPTDGGTAALHEQWYVSATNPKPGSTVVPTIRVGFNSTYLTVQYFNGSSWIGMADNDLLPVITGIKVRALRPVFGGPPQDLVFRALLAGGGAEEIPNSVKNQDSQPYVTVLLEPVSYTETTMTFRASATAPNMTPQVRFTSLVNTSVTSGQTINTLYASGTLFTVTRPATISSGEAAVKVEGFASGAVLDSDSITIPAQGQDVQRIRLSMTITPVTQLQSEILITVNDANPLPAGSYTVTLTKQGNVGLSELGPFTLSAGGTKVLLAVPPKYNDKVARLTARATAAGRVPDEDSVDIPPSDRAAESTTNGQIEFTSLVATSTAAVLTYSWPGTSTASFARLYVQETLADPGVTPTSVADTGYLIPAFELARSSGSGSVTIPGMFPGNYITVTAVPYDEINRRGIPRVGVVRLQTPANLPNALTARAAVSVTDTTSTNTVTLPTMPSGQNPYSIRTFIGGTMVSEVPVAVAAGATQTLVTTGLSASTSYSLTFALVNSVGQSTLTAPLVITTTSTTLNPPSIARTSADFTTSDYTQTATIVVTAGAGWPAGTTIEIEQTSPSVSVLATGVPGTYELTFIARTAGSGGAYSVSLRTRGRTTGGVSSSWVSLAAFTIPTWSGFL